VKNAVSFISTYEKTLAEAARRHKVEMKMIEGILYCNSGDWVESCTALVEHFDGRLELIQWANVGQPAKTTTPETVPAMFAEAGIAAQGAR